VGVLILDGLRA